MSTIMITGSRGNIGSAYTNYLRNKGNKVIGIDVKGSNHKDDIKVETIRDLNESIIFSEVDTIVHLSAISGVSEGENDPAKCIDVNVNELAQLFKILSKNNLNQKNLVLVSSADVVKFKCKQEIKPNIYSLSKYFSELTTKYFSQKYNIKSTVIRFTTIYGFDNKPDNRVVSNFIKNAFKNHPIKVLTGDIFNFIHTKDAISAIEYSVKKMKKKESGYFKEYNFFAKENLNLQELAELVVDVLDSKSKIICEKVNFKNSNLYNFGKIPDDWHQTISLKKGIKDTLTNYLSKKLI
tara:strand:- start:249 stop:1130 length:882 start_codon:yes stop_codon:yes gene_type:complete